MKWNSPIIIDTVHCGDTFELIGHVRDGSIDLIVCDGPYGVTGNDWDRISSVQDFNLALLRLFAPKLTEGGALYLFGKPDSLDFVDYRPYLHLRSRIVWYQPSRLAQGRSNYTNNYDVIHYFVKGKSLRCYNLDAIRVPQLVELEHRRRCERVPSVVSGQYGRTRYCERGKNPGDVWGDIKQLTYKSGELVSRETLNTIQKPERLIERMVLASSNPGDVVLDPFAGVGTCPVVCKRHGRRFIAFERRPEFVDAAERRLAAVEGSELVLELAHGA